MAKRSNVNYITLYKSIIYTQYQVYALPSDRKHRNATQLVTQLTEAN